MTTFSQRIVIGLLIVMIGLSAAVVGAQQATPYPTAHVTTGGATVKVYTEPSDHSNVLRLLPDGTQITIIDALSDRSWYSVRLYDNHIGWIQGTFLTLSSSAPPSTMEAEPTANPTYTSALMALQWTAQGNADYKQHQFADAIQDYTQAVGLDPTQAEAYVGRGFVYQTQGQYQQAIDDFTQAIMIDSTLAQAYASRAFAYVKLGQYEQAISDYSQAIELDPTNAPQLYTIRGEVYLTLDDYDDAIADFSQTIISDPSTSLPYFYRGISYFSKQKYAEALLDFNQAIQINPDDAYPYAWRGFTYQATRGSADQIRADFCRHAQLAGANALSSVTDQIAQHGWKCSP